MVRRMKTRGIRKANKSGEANAVNFRKLAEHHVLGFDMEMPAEKRRILGLALNEAEALAATTGVPELVLLGLAEEKVRSARQWFVRQEKLRRKSFEWQIAA